jgi:hypothetical protein
MNPKSNTPPRTNRMTLQAVQKGRQQVPFRLLVTGTDGVGKSTFAAGAPSPIFLGTEEGTHHLDVARFPMPTSWDDILDAVRTLTEDPGEFRTLVLDSVDHAEPLLWRAVCEKAGVASIEDVGGGYGKGYQVALDGWRELLAALEGLQRKRGLHVILIGHSFIKPFKNPEGEDFDRYVLKLNEKASALLREWSHGVYFANFETFAVKDKAKRVRGVSTGARLLYTQRTAAYDAKDRLGLPEVLPLDWAEFAAAAAAGRAVPPEVLRAEVGRKIELLEAEALKRSGLAAIARAGDDSQKLAQLNNWANAKLAEQGGK